MATPARLRDTPADTIVRIASDLTEQLTAVRAFFAGSNLTPMLAVITQCATRPGIDVDIVVAGAEEDGWPAAPASKDPVDSLTVRLARRCVDRSLVAPAGAPQAPVLAIPASLLHPNGHDDLFRWCADRPLVIGLNRPIDAMRPLPAGAWCTVGITGGSQELTTWLVDRSARGLWMILTAASAARALASTIRAVAIQAEAEVRALRCRRALLVQSAAASQPSRGAALDITSDIRAALQKLFSDFSRGVEERADAACSPEGAITTAVLRDVDRALAMTETAHARSVLIRIAPESERKCLDAVARHFRAHARSDITAANDLLQIAAGTAADILEARGVPADAPECKPFDSVGLDQILERQVALQRQYTGTLPKSGPFEYVMIARRYQMILFMFISAFGLSFLRTYREFMLPSAILLLSFGAFNVWLTVRREHAESRERERDKARDQLRGEIRRLLSELERGWTNSVNAELTSQLIDYTAQVSAIVAANDSRRIARVHDARHGLQRQIQGAELVERRLAALQKFTASAESAVAQAGGEIRQLLRAALGTS
jgi:hypothetical protein